MPRSAKTSTASRSNTTKATATKADGQKARKATRAASKTPKAPVLKKVEVEAMLQSAQKKLYDAETALEAQAEELAVLRVQTAEQQADLAQTRDSYYDGQVDIALAQHQAQTAQTNATTAIAEMRHMTQLLAEAETALSAANTSNADTRELDAAREETAALRTQLNAAQTSLKAAQNNAASKVSKADFDSAQKDISDLRSKLNTAQTASKDADALRKRVSEQDQRLEISTREIADLTALLDASEARGQETFNTLKIGVAVGQAAVGALIAPPDTARLDQERLNRAAAALVASGAFDPAWYLEHNGDVASTGADPALHFLEFGFAEGRAPRAPE